MRRRQWIRYCVSLPVLASALASPYASAHTPYSQWQVYRKKHLLIGCHREDLPTWELAKLLVQTLQSHLPAAKARVARAPHPQRLASLLGTDQLQFAIVNMAEAPDMIAGTGRFKPYGVLPLQALWQSGDYLLLVRSDVPVRHGWLVSQALDGAAIALSSKHQSADGETADARSMDEFLLSADISWHEGAVLYRNGQQPPE